MHSPPKCTLSKLRSKGDKIWYNEKSVMTKDGVPRTMFRTDDGIKYSEKQK